MRLSPPVLVQVPGITPTCRIVGFAPLANSAGCRTHTESIRYGLTLRLGRSLPCRCACWPRLSVGSDTVFAFRAFRVVVECGSQ